MRDPKDEDEATLRAPPTSTVPLGDLKAGVPVTRSGHRGLLVARCCTSQFRAEHRMCGWGGETWQLPVAAYSTPILDRKRKGEAEQDEARNERS